MNEHGVITTKAEKEELIGMKYPSLKEEGTFIAKLEHRHWYNRNGVYALVCSFCDKTERRFQLFAFRHNKGPEIYAPKESDVDWSKEVQDNTWWKLIVRKNKSGNCTWINAETIQSDEQNA